jgi:hypothetical protein
MVMTFPDPVADAVAAVVAAVIEDYPFALARRQGELVVEQLRRDGWVICAPEAESTPTATNSAKGLRGASEAA